MKIAIKLIKINKKNHLIYQNNYKISKFKIMINFINKLIVFLKMKIIINNQIFIKKALKFIGINKLYKMN